MKRDDLRIAREAKARFGPQLLAHPDVEGVGVGRRRRSGDKTDEYAVVVHLRQKRPESYVSPARLLPKELRFTEKSGRDVAVRVDVQQHAKPVPETGRVRPVPGGVSVGTVGTHVGSGTLGGWVWDTVTRQVVALSNAHVFGSRLGVSIVQPSSDDGGVPPDDRIAAVLRTGSLDAAIAEPADVSIVSASIVQGGPAVFEIAEATLDMRVQKTGRATGLTFGIVDLIDFDSDYRGSHSDLWIDAEGGDFSLGGDSGALYLLASGNAARAAEKRQVVGLHWGGSGQDGVGHHIRAVFDDLKLSTLPRGINAPAVDAAVDPA
ncbi:MULTISPECIES: hypothetical protein [unclassified Streptomyces]|uniref:hypothetical protein n=1 Tax=unclassified Streptomyces TaxID=2593676 RepID=UPI002E1115B1|nr:hypothetical protein OG725_35165 [Streptomyces sp. NBC_01213]WSR04657.1 hypothetical protein OG265_00940 [Streptomyces sp. NBC_01208]